MFGKKSLAASECRQATAVLVSFLSGDAALSGFAESAFISNDDPAAGGYILVEDGGGIGVQ